MVSLAGADMRRREFIAGLVGAAIVPLLAAAQQAQPMRRVGVLMNGAATETVPGFVCGGIRARTAAAGMDRRPGIAQSAESV
jgi:hypothetical protein